MPNISKGSLLPKFTTVKQKNKKHKTQTTKNTNTVKENKTLLEDIYICKQKERKFKINKQKQREKFQHNKIGQMKTWQ